jgi:hypothetical protein
MAMDIGPDTENQEITGLLSAQDHETENLPLRKIGSWVPQDLEQSMPMLEKARNIL